MLDLLPTQRRCVKAAREGVYDYILWAGGVRSGKTMGCAMALAGISRRLGKGDDCLIAGRTLGALERNVAPYFRNFAKQFDLDYDAKFVGTNPHLMLDGKRFLLFGCNTSKSESNISGATVAAAFVDEAALIPESVWNQITLRCSKLPGVILAGVNKTNPFGWFKTEVWDRSTEMNALRLENTIHENRFLSKKVLQRYESSYSGHYRRRYIDNEWAAAGGNVYQDWTMDDHVPHPNAKAVVAMDWGVSGVTTALYFFKREYGYLIGKVYGHDARKGKRLTEVEHVEAVTDVNHEIKEVVIDPSAVPLIDAFRKRGVYTVSARNDLDRGIITTDHALRQGHLRLQPQACKPLLAELDAYVWSGREDKPVKKDDHYCDAMRYGAMRLLPMRYGTPTELQGY